MQSKINQPNWVNYLTLVIVVLGLAGLYAVMPNAPEVQEPVDLTVLEAAVAVLAAEVQALNTETEITIDSNYDRLCELTDGCEYYEISNSQANDVRDVVEDEEDDFFEAFAELVGVDEDYLDIRDIDHKETQVRAYSEDDKDDENYEVQLFYKVKYKDVDNTDFEYAYILVTSMLDEGDYDSLTLEEVSRTFEF